MLRKDEQLDVVKYQRSILEAWLDKQCEVHKNCKKGKIYIDTKTGRKFKRNAYQEMMEAARRGEMNYIVF